MVFERPCRMLKILEDNQSMMKIMSSGKHQTMRHVPRTHRVSIQWLHEVFQEPFLSLEYVESCRQAADIFTKGFSNPEKWAAVCTLIYHINPKDFWKAPADEESIPILPAVEEYISSGYEPESGARQECLANDSGHSPKEHLHHNNHSVRNELTKHSQSFNKADAMPSQYILKPRLRV